MAPERELARHGSRALIARLKQAMEATFPGALEEVDGLFLLTNCPFRSELDAVAAEAQRILGLKMTRFVPEDWVVGIPVDIAIASAADYFFYTYCGSFYSGYIEQERNFVDGAYQPHSNPHPAYCLNSVVPNPVPAIADQLI